MRSQSGDKTPRQPKQKPYKLFDERGLFILVVPTGGRLWRFRYCYGGKEKLLAIGAYPDDVPLRRAREKRDEAGGLVSDGVDPSAQRKIDRVQRLAERRKLMQVWSDYLQSLSASADVVPLLRSA